MYNLSYIKGTKSYCLYNAANGSMIKRYDIKFVKKVDYKQTK